MKVVAKAEITGTICAAPSTLWEKTKGNAGISRKKYREYFHGCKRAYAYELGQIQVFDVPKSLSDFNISLAPQSFAYVELACDELAQRKVPVIQLRDSSSHHRFNINLISSTPFYHLFTYILLCGHRGKLF